MAGEARTVTSDDRLIARIQRILAIRFNASDEIVRAIIGEVRTADAPLRAALAEALDAWQRWIDDGASPADHPLKPDLRIAELRKLVAP